MEWEWREEQVPGNPWANMATDLALFESLQTPNAQRPIVRIYRWDRPSVTFGRLQDEERVRAEFPGLPCVRRPTGGRAVRHGEDLTISVITRDAWLPKNTETGVLASYRTIVRGIIAAYAEIGTAAALGSENSPRRIGNEVDCFATTAACDIVAQETGKKLVGSAQRRQNGAILQQMSLPALSDEHAFINALRRTLKAPLGVTAWLSVDTDSRL